jgi:hypothetical protein
LPVRENLGPATAIDKIVIEWEPMARAKILPRDLRAYATYLRLLLQEFKGTLLFTAGILVAGALLFHFLLEDPARHAHPDYAESLYRTFLLMTLNMPDDFPVHPLLRLWCFSVPFLSFLVVSEAVVRLAVLLSSRANSGGRWIKAMAAVYSDHVILCGLGRLGSSILAQSFVVGQLHELNRPPAAS